MAMQQKRRVRTLRDRLSHLNFAQACKLLGPDGKKLLRSSAKLLQLVDVGRDVYLRGDLFLLDQPGVQAGRSAPGQKRVNDIENIIGKRGHAWFMIPDKDLGLRVEDDFRPFLALL